MMNSLKCLLVAGALAAAAPAAAQQAPPAIDPAEAEVVAALLKEMRMGDQILINARAGFYSVAATRPDRSVPPHRLAEVERAFLAEMAARTPQLEQEFAAIYSKHFTHAELQGMLAFYQSPAGQALLDKSEALSVDGVALVSREIEGIIQSVMARLDRGKTRPPS